MAETTQSRQGFIIRLDIPHADEADPIEVYPANTRWTSIDSVRTHAWCMGELLSYGGNGAVLGSEACLRAVLLDWEADKLDFTRLNGRFTLIFCDKQSREWTLITDRVGAMHCYAAWNGDRLTAIGSDLPTLAQKASTRQLNWEAIASFFCFGFFLDDQTYFTDIKILHPRSIYRIKPTGELREHRYYWQWSHQVDAQRSYEQTVETYDSLFRQAMQRCTVHSRIALPVSGGLDSRSLAATLPQNVPVEAYSYGYTADSIET
jgi:asparagine synthetase B (glutamine-hydrolysing)